jgi:2'-hydroxyisoflavone reductase
MRILFMGGTRFVGLAMVQCALARGHQVDVFHRGSSPAPALAGVKTILGDRNLDLSALANGEWDAVVDVCAYRPHEVESLATALGQRAGLSVLVSSISAYADDVPLYSNERAALMDTSALAGQDLHTIPIDGNSYGALKVLCERALAQHCHKHLIIRPTFVIGPNDYTQRFPEWVRRIAAGGDVSAPGPRDAPMSYIDTRDLAAFVILCIERGSAGVFNVAATTGPFSFQNFLEATVNAVGPVGTRLQWLPPDEAKACGKQFPLWTAGAYEPKLAVDSGAARACGLTCRPLQESAQDVARWLKAVQV